MSGERAGGGGVNVLAWHHACASGVICATCSLTGPVRVSEPRGEPLDDAGPPQAVIARAARERSVIGGDTLTRIPRLSDLSAPGYVAQASVLSPERRWWTSKDTYERQLVRLKNLVSTVRSCPSGPPNLRKTERFVAFPLVGA